MFLHIRHTNDKETYAYADEAGEHAEGTFSSAAASAIARNLVPFHLMMIPPVLDGYIVSTNLALLLSEQLYRIVSPSTLSLYLPSL